MRDKRRLPLFYWQSQEAMATIRHCFVGQERSTAIAIYQSMTELANHARREDPANASFTITRKQFAEHCGVSDRTLDRYMETFERVGLVEVDRNVDSHGRQPSCYALLPDSEMTSQPMRNDVTSQDAKPDRKGGEMTSLPLDGMEEELREEQDERAHPRSELSGQIEEIWSHYVEVMKPRNTELDPEARKIIREALKVATVDECKRAIDGCSSSSFHMGHNDRKKKYNTISQILKAKQGRYTTRERIDYFIDQLASNGNPARTGANLKVPLDLTGVPPVTAGTIRMKRSHVRTMVERGDDATEYERQQGATALDWLREKCGHQPVIEDGKVMRWEAAS